MTITNRSPLREVALAVARALAEHGIRGVLTGGACASLHARGRYLSEDLDFILEGRVVVAELERAMASIGFVRRANRYVHPKSRFWVEFPRGPLALGADLEVRPVALGRASARLLALSPTDSCRDRLAAFYHWNDRQSLAVALEIAKRHEIDVDLIRRWSEREGHAARFEEFLRQLAPSAPRTSKRARVKAR